MSKDQRIGILGAGPAGLSAAEALREKGHTNVMILEKRDRVGGQTLSNEYVTPSGKKIVYDLGSIQPTGTNSGAMNKLIKRYGMHLGRGLNLTKPAKIKIYDLENKEYILDFLNYTFGKKLTLKSGFLYLHDIFILARLLFKYRCLSKPGYDQLSQEQIDQLCVPLDQWIANLPFKMISKDLLLTLGTIMTFSNATLKDPVTGMGAVKLIFQLTRLPVRYLDGSMMQLREGYQELWKRVAASNHVQLNCQIQNIIRETDQIRVSTSNGEYVFDKIIIACTGSDVLNFLDASPLEKNIFSSARYAPGWRGAFLAKNLPHDACYMFPYSYTHPNTSIITGYIPEGQVDDETWLYQCLLPYNHQDNTVAPTSEAEKFLTEAYGARDIQWIQTTYWKEYGCYLPISEVKKGIYREIRESQGKNNTYYAGEIISCGLNSLVSDYSYHLINKYFK